MGKLGENRKQVLSRSKIYKCWQGIRQRCNNPKSDRFKDYGAKGISVCDRWRVFVNFLEDMGQPPTPSHTIDRIDGTKGYFKENCKWSTPREQSANLKSNRLLTFNGETFNVREWARQTGIDRSTINGRLRAGWPVEKTLTEPIQVKRR